MTTYWVVATSWGSQERSPLKYLFATPFQADNYRASMAMSHAGYRYWVRPATWQEREERMFFPDNLTGRAIYEHPVWAEEKWWQDVAHRFKDHYVHISFLDPTAVAFTEDPIKGEADRQTMMRPGKYLQKFLGAGPSGDIEHGPLKGLPPQITKMQVAYYADWHQTGKRPETDDVLAFTEDADEMVRLYEDGPESCMMGKGWPTEHHPVRVYAGGGLALAYMTSTSGDVIGRALCWPAREVFGRVYPTPNSDADRERYDELMARLKSKGWKSIVEDNTVFEGALLTRVMTRYGDYAMPYLDNEYGVREVYRDGKTWWQMTHDEDHQENTDGTLTGNNHENDWTCECCEDQFDEDTSSYSVYSRWVRNNRRPDGTFTGYPGGEQTWCEGCRDYRSFFCDGSDEHYMEDADNVSAVDGCTYERTWFTANGGWQCVVSEEYYLREDDEPVKLADGSLIHADSVDDETFVCLYTGCRWLNEHQSSAVPGYANGFDSWSVHPAEFENVMPAVPEDPADVEAWARAYAIPHDLRPFEDPVVIDLTRSLLTYNAASIITTANVATVSLSI